MVVRDALSFNNDVYAIELAAAQMLMDNKDYKEDQWIMDMFKEREAMRQYPYEEMQISFEEMGKANAFQDQASFEDIDMMMKSELMEDLLGEIRKSLPKGVKIIESNYLGVKQKDDPMQYHFSLAAPGKEFYIDLDISDPGFSKSLKKFVVDSLGVDIFKDGPKRGHKPAPKRGKKPKKNLSIVKNHTLVGGGLGM